MPSKALGKLAWVVLEISPWCCVYRRAGRLTNSATTQGQIQGFELVHPNIYPIYELLEVVKVPFLKTQSFRIFMKQGNNMIS